MRCWVHYYETSSLYNWSESHICITGIWSKVMLVQFVQFCDFSIASVLFSYDMQKFCQLLCVSTRAVCSQLCSNWLHSLIICCIMYPQIKITFSTDVMLFKYNTQAHTTLLTVVELAVALLTVDDVKTIGDVCHHVTDFKVKPLGVLGAVSIRIQYEVIFISTQERREETATNGFMSVGLRFCECSRIYFLC